MFFKFYFLYFYIYCISTIPKHEMVQEKIDKHETSQRLDFCWTRKTFAFIIFHLLFAIFSSFSSFLRLLCWCCCCCQEILVFSLQLLEILLLLVFLFQRCWSRHRIYKIFAMHSVFMENRGNEQHFFFLIGEKSSEDLESEEQVFAI